MVVFVVGIGTILSILKGLFTVAAVGIAILVLWHIFDAM